MCDPADPHSSVPLVAIDCEMVQVVGGKQVLAHICAVDGNEAVLLNTYVAPGAPVKDYLTRYSGLRAGDLDGAPSFDSVRAQVAALLEGSILVGHAPSNDLRALQLVPELGNVARTSEQFDGTAPRTCAAASSCRSATSASFAAARRTV